MSLEFLYLLTLNFSLLFLSLNKVALIVAVFLCTFTLCIFCNPSCSTDSSVVKASESQIPFSHPVLCCGTRPFETVFWVAKRLEVAQKVAKNLVPLQPGPRFATDPFDSDPPTRDSTAKLTTVPSSTMAVARRPGARSTGPILLVDATGTIDRCLCRLRFCFRKRLAGSSRRFPRPT